MGPAAVGARTPGGPPAWRESQPFRGACCRVPGAAEPGGSPALLRSDGGGHATDDEGGVSMAKHKPAVRLTPAEYAGELARDTARVRRSCERTGIPVGRAEAVIAADLAVVAAAA